MAEQPGCRSSMNRRVVHLELHTDNLPRACAFYARLLGFRFESLSQGSRSYLAMDLGGGVGGGVVECGARQPGWLPYVEVDDVRERTERARTLGATVLLEPREGPGGWRSVVSEPAAGEVALWRPKSL